MTWKHLRISGPLWRNLRLSVDSQSKGPVTRSFDQQTASRTVELPVTWDAATVMWCYYHGSQNYADGDLAWDASLMVWASVDIIGRFWSNNSGLFCVFHDDVVKWKHFPRYWPFVRGIHRSPVNSPHKRQWRGALVFSVICVWINAWANNRKAGDLRRHYTHYDVTVMQSKGPVTRSFDQQAASRTVGLPVTWDAVTVMCCHYHGSHNYAWWWFGLKSNFYDLGIGKHNFDQMTTDYSVFRNGCLTQWSFNKMADILHSTFGNESHFADDIFKCIFLNENVWIPIKISLKFVPEGPINIIPALVQIMAWRRSGNKPLSEPMMISLPTQICVTRPQCVKNSVFWLMFYYILCS